MQQAAASAREVQEITRQTSDKPLWTNGLFSGMPAYMIDFDYPNTFIYKTVAAVQNLLPNTANIVFVLMGCTYILLVVLGCNAWLSALGAAAYGFGTFGIVSLEAGHVSKLLAMGYGPVSWRVSSWPCAGATGQARP